jgi:hypothetical protein
MMDPGPTMAARVADHFEAIGKDNVRAAEIYAESIVLEYVNSGERIRGKAAIIASREAYPGRPSFFEIRRSGGTSELQVVELTMHIEGDAPHPVVAVMDFEAGRCVRERIYVAEPWEPAPYRTEWAESVP